VINVLGNWKPICQCRGQRRNGASVDEGETSVSKLPLQLSSLLQYESGLMVCPFQRYVPHRYPSSLLSENKCAESGGGRVVFDGTNKAPSFQYFRGLCANGGSWFPTPGPVTSFQLVAVEAISHSEDYYSAFERGQKKMSAQRLHGGSSFNFDTCSFSAPQQLVHNILREQFHERAPGTPHYAPQTFF
jgi:hypothetical protein